MLDFIFNIYMYLTPYVCQYTNNNDYVSTKHIRGKSLWRTISVYIRYFVIFLCPLSMLWEYF